MKLEINSIKQGMNNITSNNLDSLKTIVSNLDKSIEEKLYNLNTISNSILELNQKQQATLDLTNSIVQSLSLDEKDDKLYNFIDLQKRRSKIGTKNANQDSHHVKDNSSGSKKKVDVLANMNYLQNQLNKKIHN